MLKILFKKYNQYRKEKYFQSPLFGTKKKYACIGIGIHSLTNIYPVLRHFNIQVKYICTRSTDWSKAVAQLFPGCIFTNDMQAILNDTEIEGVFVSASPEAHYGLLYVLLKAGKKVFIEKPPCHSLTELNTLVSINKHSVCKAGLQRRYWPGNQYLLQPTTKIRSYIYQFYFGPYPQGNVFYELFIHAIDYCVFLFGDFTILSNTFQKDSQGITLQLHVKHSGGIAGMMELSSHYSWNDPVESMSIQCADELLTVRYPLQVTGLQKPKRVLNIPVERLYRKPIITKNYFSVSSLLVPALELNTLVLQGFYKELETFIQIVESDHNSCNGNDLVGLVPVYKILDDLNESSNRAASL
ncbi:MAG: Gfo/Idh/MocA family oxidoreductase [Chitinophagaceae bacterium]